MMNIKTRIIALLLCYITLPFDVANSQDTQLALKGDQLIRSWVKFWNEKDIDQIDQLYADNAVFEDVAEGAAYEGLSAIKQCLIDDITFVPDIKVEIISILVAENQGVLEWRWFGTQTGDIPGLMPATGRKFSIRGISLFEFRNNKIVKQSDYYDAATFLYQLGVKFEFPKEE
jgi:steroid delta-isomerase-like uncharacterized protein